MRASIHLDAARCRRVEGELTAGADGQVDEQQSLGAALVEFGRGSVKQRIHLKFKISD